MVKNGHDKRGIQRFKCVNKNCGKTQRRHYDDTTHDFAVFLDFITGKTCYKDFPGNGRTLRRKNEKFWKIWPVSLPVDEHYRVIHVDGIYLHHQAVVLIACTSDNTVIAWHVARNENIHAYQALLMKIPAPDMVVCDGGTGFITACHRVWPTTRIQRCVFHVYNQVKRYTTTHPMTPAGQDLYHLACCLLHVKDTYHADQWIQDFSAWTNTYKNFLAQKSLYDNGRIDFTHKRLVKASHSITRVIRSKHLFTFLDPGLYTKSDTQDFILPSTNNQIEGGINSQLRRLLDIHRGMGLNHQLCMVGWWCYLHTANPLPPAQILAIMPTDTIITHQWEMVEHLKKLKRSNGYDTGVVWNEFHSAMPWNNFD